MPFCVLRGAHEEADYVKAYVAMNNLKDFKEAWA